MAPTAKKKPARSYRRFRPSYGVYAYFPARLAYTPEGDAKEKLLNALAKECGGYETGSGTGLVGRLALRDLSFGFKTRKDAQRFLNKLATRKIKRDGKIIDYTKPPYTD